MKLKAKLTTGHFIDLEDAFADIDEKFGVYNDASKVVTAAIRADMFSDVDSDIDINEFIRATDPLELRAAAKAVNNDYLEKYTPQPPDPNF